MQIRFIERLTIDNCVTMHYSNVYKKMLFSTIRLWLQNFMTLYIFIAPVCVTQHQISKHMHRIQFYRYVVCFVQMLEYQ